MMKFFCSIVSSVKRNKVDFSSCMNSIPLTIHLRPLRSSLEEEGEAGGVRRGRRWEELEGYRRGLEVRRGCWRSSK